jgi:hypothetical protein
MQYGVYLTKYKKTRCFYFIRCDALVRLALQQYICMWKNNHEGQWESQNRKERTWKQACSWSERVPTFYMCWVLLVPSSCIFTHKLVSYRK